MTTFNAQKGFTLIELMIVVVIIGILAAIAYPSYQAQVVKTRRAEAQTNLMEIQQHMERFYTENGRYDQDTGGDAVTLPFNKSPKDGNLTIYNITFAAGEPTSTTFALVATPTGAQASNDTECGVVSIDSTGAKCIKNGSQCSDSGTAAVRDAVAKCW